MTACKHFGKTPDELDAELGLTWILKNCDGCPLERACEREAKKKEASP